MAAKKVRDDALASVGSATEGSSGQLRAGPGQARAGMGSNACRPGSQARSRGHGPPSPHFLVCLGASVPIGQVVERLCACAPARPCAPHLHFSR